MGQARRFLVTSFLFLAWVSWSETRAAAYGLDDDGKTLYGGIGLVSPNAGKLSGSPSGSSGLTTTLLPYLALSAQLGLGLGWGISPFIAYTPLGHKSPEGGEKVTLLPAAVRASKTIGPIDLFLGPGLQLYNISGSGGTTVLNNGTSTTTFGLPSDSKGSVIGFWDAGLGVGVSRFRFDVDALVNDTFSSARRSVDLLATFSYGLL